MEISLGITRKQYTATNSIRVSLLLQVLIVTCPALKLLQLLCNEQMVVYNLRCFYSCTGVYSATQEESRFFVTLHIHSF